MSEPDFPTLAEPTPRQPRRTARGTMLRWLLRSILGLLTVVLVVLLVRSSWTGQVERPVSLAADPQILPISQPRTEPDTTKPAPDPQQQAWENSVVAIQSGDTIHRTSHGSGFFVGDTGLVATNLHVSATCTEATVRLADGTIYDVAGYAAVDPAHDLALLALREGPRNVVGLPLNAEADPPRRQQVWAIGHPQGIEYAVSTGEVSRVLETSELPAASQRFVRELAPSVSASRWIQHSASIAPGSSGGPLLNAAGRVLGINTWVDQQARFNYALHVQHLLALLPQAKSEKLQPLAAYATPEARTAQQLWQLSAERLRRLLDQGRGMKWQPQSADDYRTLQQLAWAITVARLPDTLAARGTLGERLEELARSADAAAAELRKEKWDNPGQLTILNEYAALELRQPQAGLFLFVTVERVVQGSDGRRGLIATLAGFDNPLFFPLEDQLVVPDPGSQCLVLGVNYHGRVAQWGENPLQLINAPIIVPGMIVKLE